MNQRNINKLGLYGFIVVLILLLSGLLYLNYSVTKDYNEKLNQMSVQFNEKNTEIKQQINDAEKKSMEERQLLESQMLDNFKKLETTINTETAKVKLNLESQLEDVSIKFDETSSKLADKISTISVESSDFSAIIDDVIKGVVSVKTNKGSGSGAIFDKTGYVMTNRHVIEGASVVMVVDYGGLKYPARIVALAKNVDLAVLKIESDTSFTALKFAEIDDIKVGSKVIAIGNPLGLSFTVTEGIVSSNNRVVEGQAYIQTDVPINAGNSGGPIVNSAKRIIGINTFKLINTEGLGFAIPSNVAKELADQTLGK